ncbi:MAG: hypothetical protein GEU90_05350 [Gemmatimonas sp.]|nr:hypothetical protein [Gemmatimonas sp.]
MENFRTRSSHEPVPAQVTRVNTMLSVLPMITISISDARRIVLRAQGLDVGWPLSPGIAGAAEAIARLGYVQIDTIAVIERAHHHVLWTRHRDYVPAMLDVLLSRDRSVFESWTHAAAYLPVSVYRYYLPMMRAFAQRPKIKAWRAGNRRVVRHVLERIRAEGALRSADFARPPEKRGPWWDWTPTKRALEILFRSGQLMIAGRHNFQRVYDLTERVLPAGTDTSRPRPAEVARYVVHRTLAAQGIATDREAAWWSVDRKTVAAALAELVDAGKVAEVRVRSLDGTPYYVAADALDAALDRPTEVASVRLLSPFDNLIIDRGRTLRFFDFDYRIECYTPEPKRKYGYFTLPILWGDRLVGRLDPKADRRRRTFIVRNLLLEPGFQQVRELAPVLGHAVHEFAAFHGCEQVTVEAPESLDRTIVDSLARS